MKARTVQAPRLIVSYGLDSSRLQQLSLFCDRENITLRPALPGEADCTVGYLCGFKGFDPAPECEQPPQLECLIFSGFDRRSLSETVDALRTAGLKVDLKAVCTPSNQAWKLSALIGELAKEHEYMTGGKK
ncbi:MAG: DUF3783 domain-containing protein [Ruminococcus sp.]|nr:DUF3783 domain-containing protein [Ruminococcus sp.]